MSVNRWWSVRCLLVIGIGLPGVLMSPDHAVSDEPANAPSQKFGQIVDSAHMFDPSLVRFMESDLEFEAQNAKLPILIETIESLQGRTIHDAIDKKVFAPNRDGVYVLLAKKERKIEVRVSKRFASVIDESDRMAIREAFIDGLKQEKPEVAVAEGVRAISRALRKARRAEFAPADRVLAADASPSPKSAVADQGAALVVRNQVKLALSGARRIIEGAEAKASAMGLKVNIAIVDDGGHLLSFARMDGARPASGYTALTKATTAATFRQETGPLPKGAAEPDVLLNLSLQNAAAASGGKLTTLFGGVPVIVDDQVIGAVGVGGGTGEQDATVSKAGIEAFLKDLKASRSPSAPETENLRRP